MRDLPYFLYSGQTRRDDVIAEDFFTDDSAWLHQRPAKSPRLITIYERVAKEVAQLTYARAAVTPEAKQWPFLEIPNQIGTVIRGFFGWFRIAGSATVFADFFLKL